MIYLIVVVVKGGKNMAIKMRNNTDRDAVCCECGDTQDQVLNMFDLCVGGNVLTFCDVCNEAIFNKTLRAECYKNGRVKQPRDISIINRRQSKARGLSWGGQNK